jgi:hypothetical protein
MRARMGWTAAIAASSAVALALATVFADDAYELIFWLTIAGGVVLLADVLIRLRGL